MCESDSLDSRTDAALQRQMEATVQALQAGQPDTAARRLAKQVHRDMSAAIDALPSKGRHACAPGCDFCCYLPVDVLPPEAFHIAAHLQEARSPAQLSELVYQLGIHQQHGLGTRPCVFLSHGQCSIYEVRPMVCRGYNSLSKERCEDYFQDASVDLKGTKDRLAGRLAEAMEEGVIAGLTALGLDAQWYELPSAVLRAMEAADSPARWARGEAVFEGCDQLSQWGC